MKTIGIITMHQVQNAGSVLQAYALLTKLAQLGYMPYTIDYVYPNIYHLLDNPKASLWDRVKFRILYNPSVQRQRFQKFIKENLNLTNRYSTQEEILQNPPIFDIYMTGSDQVWNYKCMKGDPVFFCAFADDKPCCSYASSFVSNSLPDTYKRLYQTALEKYVALGVREESGRRMIYELTGKTADVVCDPTLLLLKEDYIPVINQSVIKRRKPYLLAYILDYAFNPYPTINVLIDKASKELGLEVVYLLANTINNYHIGKSITTAGPSEFLYLIKNASFVITSSFHGVAFCVNFNIPFYAVVPDSSSDDRIESLLEKVGAMSRMIQVNEDLSKLQLSYRVDYAPIIIALDKYRKESIDFIIKSLQLCCDRDV